MNTTTCLCLSKEDTEARKQRVLAILAAGHVVRFRNRHNGITKDVKEWNVDKYGDLTAFRHTGTTPYVCWDGWEYEVEDLGPQN